MIFLGEWCEATLQTWLVTRCRFLIAYDVVAPGSSLTKTQVQITQRCCECDRVSAEGASETDKVNLCGNLRFSTIQLAIRSCLLVNSYLGSLLYALEIVSLYN